jgi:vacuolar-type H+-ATPase subunit H
VRAEAESYASRLRDDARTESTRVVAEAREEATEVQRIAEVFATQTREDAEAAARKQLGRARELAAEVLQDGTDMSQHLDQLSDSLRRNAELLLRDVSAAHRAMTDKLDEAGVELGEPRTRTRAPVINDVPEFIPRSPR